MTTKLPSPTTIGSQVTTVSVLGVTIRADGAILADWQGLDKSGVAVVRQPAAFTKEAAAELLAGPASGLLAATEKAIVSAIAQSGQPPASQVPNPAVPSPATHAAAGSRIAMLAARARASRPQTETDEIATGDVGALPPELEHPHAPPDPVTPPAAPPTQMDKAAAAAAAFGAGLRKS
jgi:hypothetical protein